MAKKNCEAKIHERKLDHKSVKQEKKVLLNK